MRAPFKATVLLAVMLLVSSAFGQTPPAVYVGDVQGLDVDGKIPAGGGDITIPIHFYNTDGVDDNRTAVSNGYYFYSPDGIMIGGIDFAKNCVYNVDIACAIPNGCYPFDPFFCYSWFDMYFDTTQLSKGLGGIGIAGLAENGTGLPPAFNDWIYSFTVTGIAGPAGSKLVLDTTYWEPGNFWLWTGVGGEVEWGGPYEFVMGGEPQCDPNTTCWPNPFEIGVNDNGRVLVFNIWCEDPDNVDMASLRVYGKIPCYTNDGIAIAEGDSIYTDAYLMRFLGSGGWRPLPPDDYAGTYTLHYTRLVGGDTILEGDFEQMISQGDVTFDGVANGEDVVFMIDYLFNKGEPCSLDGYRMDECMDFDQSGRFDLLDVRALIEYVY